MVWDSSMSRFLIFTGCFLFWVVELTGQDRKLSWEKEPDIIRGYQRFIAEGGDYDTLSSHILNRLMHQANASYYGPKMILENFAKNHVLACNAYRKREFTEAQSYAQIALHWAAKINDNYCTAASFRILSDIYEEQGRYDSALHYKTRALMIYQQLPQSASVGLMHYQIGNLYYEVSDYDASLFHLNEFLKKDRRQNLNRTLQAYNRIGRIYDITGESRIAVGYFEQAAELAQSHALPRWLTASKGNIGRIYFKEKKYAQAAPLLEMSYLAALQYGDTSLAVTEGCTLAEIYFLGGNRAKTEELIKKVERLHTPHLSPEAHLAYLHCRYMLAKTKSNWQEALQLLETYTHLSDSLTALRYRQTLEQVRMMNATAVQKMKEELNTKKTEASERQRDLLLIGGGLFLLVLIPLFVVLLRLNRKYKKANLALKRSQHEVSLKNKQLEQHNKQIAAQAANLEKTVKERTRDLEATIKGLNSHNKDLEQFSYIVSHNIRSPVSQILGLIGIFNFDKPDDPLNAEILKNLQKSAANLDQVIKDLNTIISTRQSLDALKEKVDLEEIMCQVLVGLESEIAAAQASIQYDFTLQPELYTVRGYMHSILHNLVSNAIKYRAEHRKPHIAISADPLGEFCCLTVADNGLGIDSEKNDTYKIFGLYQRMHTHIEGKGLGLYLVKTQVESLGGTVSLESVLGKGTVFRIMLPV